MNQAAVEKEGPILLKLDRAEGHSMLVHVLDPQLCGRSDTLSSSGLVWEAVSCDYLTDIITDMELQLGKAWVHSFILQIHPFSLCRSQ